MSDRVHIEYVDTDLFRVNIDGAHHVWMTSDQMYDFSWALWRALEENGLVETEEEVTDKEFEAFAKKLARKHKMKVIT